MVGDREVRPVNLEFTLLRVLASDPTRVFTKKELHRDVWSHSPPAFFPGRWAAGSLVVGEGEARAVVDASYLTPVAALLEAELLSTE
jgi:hypothetical protein